MLKVSVGNKFAPALWAAFQNNLDLSALPRVSDMTFIDLPNLAMFSPVLSAANGEVAPPVNAVAPQRASSSAAISPIIPTVYALLARKFVVQAPAPPLLDIATDKSCSISAASCASPNAPNLPQFLNMPDPPCHANPNHLLPILLKSSDQELLALYTASLSL